MPRKAAPHRLSSPTYRWRREGHKGPVTCSHHTGSGKAGLGPLVLPGCGPLSSVDSPCQACPLLGPEHAHSVGSSVSVHSGILGYPHSLSWPFMARLHCSAFSPYVSFGPGDLDPLPDSLLSPTRPGQSLACDILTGLCCAGPRWTLSSLAWTVQ